MIGVNGAMIGGLIGGAMIGVNGAMIGVMIISGVGDGVGVNVGGAVGVGVGSTGVGVGVGGTGVRVGVTSTTLVGVGLAIWVSTQVMTSSPKVKTPTTAAMPQHRRSTATIPTGTTHLGRRALCSRLPVMTFAFVGAPVGVAFTVKS
jgi:hypothetical protein